MPKSRGEYWLPKLERNVARDRANRDTLLSKGWKVLVVWECETKDLPKLQEIIVSFLGPSKSSVSDVTVTSAGALSEPFKEFLCKPA